MNNYNYNMITPFKWFVIQNFPFIEAEFDAMTNWDLFCKLGKEMNKIIKSVNLSGEQVEKLTNAFNELQNYVNNYFDNLDIQDEINIKLDEMAESGVLEEIIAQYISISSINAFDSVSDMINATNLINGSFAETYGYYAKNDGGSAKYKIRNVTNQDVTNNYNLIALSNENLVAELIPDKIVSVKQLAVKGDGETDDTQAIQNVFNNYKDIFFPDGIYMINADISVFPKSNSNIILSKNAILKAITNNNDNYIIVSFNNVSNINFKGGQILGDVDTHTGSTGEWGMGISINHNASNIYIKETYITKCWGDGLYINLASNITTEKVVAKYNRRQGLSIISVDGYTSINDDFSETSGTAPEAGVDIEPNLSTDILNKILFINPKTKNNNGAGIQIYITKELTTPIDIKIINHFDYGSKDAFNVHKIYNVDGHIDIITPNYDMNKWRGICSNGYFGNKCLLYFDRPRITNCNQDNQTAFNYSIPIIFYNTTDDTENSIGNIIIKEPYLDNPNQTNQCCIAIRNSSKVEKVKIINPTFARGSVWCDNDLILEDINKVFVAKSNYDWPISAVSIRSLYTNQNATADRTYSINNNVPLNFRFTITNNNTSSKKLDIQLGSNLICRNFSTTAGIKLRLSNFGDSITFEKISDTELIATNIVGTPTIVS